MARNWLMAVVICGAVGTAQAQLFDDRWFISGLAGGAVTDQSDTDSGLALYGAFGKTLYPRFTVEGEIEYEEVSVSDLDNDFTRLGGGVKAVYEIFSSERLSVGPLLALSVREIDFLGATQTGFGAATGLQLASTLNNNVELLGEARYILDPTEDDGPINGDTFYTWTLTAGLRYKFGQWPPPPPDEDGDGVPNSADKCRGTPPGVVVDPFGCPLDNDGDGVPDYQDRCPNTPEGVPVNEFGCPLDSDADGVPDIRDKCPDTPPGVPVDADGCPLDSDGDGVPDAKDLCPGTPIGAEVDKNGCPFDTDQDGVPDYRDDCPNTPYGVPVNERGCSRDNDGDGVENELDLCPNTYPGLAVDATGCAIKNQTLTLHNVHFEFNRADLVPDSRTLLNKVAKSLNDQPDLRIEVGGHTDAVGSNEYNLELSQKRAESVRRYLIAQGVDPTNVTARGYGEEQPLASNETDEGRARNRRVEIKLLD